MSSRRLPWFSGLLSAAALVLVSASASANLFSDSFEPPFNFPANDAEAARFLNQATFGARQQDIAGVRSQSVAGWLNSQLNHPTVTLSRPWLEAYAAALPSGSSVNQDARIHRWFDVAVNAPDQVRQKVAYALSQIVVASDRDDFLGGEPIQMAEWNDILVRNALGNYRQLLMEVTYSPMMGRYLTHLRNRKFELVRNTSGGNLTFSAGNNGVQPDENYAREIMQLFSIGLVRLGPDGRVLDGDPQQPGIQPIPTYDQDTIRGFAHVFTGWHFSSCAPPRAAEGGSGFNPQDFFRCASGPESQDIRRHSAWWEPLKPWGEGTPYGDIYHASAGSKQLLDYPGVALAGGVLPAGGNARGNLQAALDNIFHHPNLGPFLAHRLIQRLVTSNPSPAYVQRVAQAFNDNGQGVRGDMRAVIRAILLDPEARRLEGPAHFGKVREPVLRLTQLWRAMDVVLPGEHAREGSPYWFAGQGALQSPTVFNFFQPDYALPGEVASLGLASPELQIGTDTYLQRTASVLGQKTLWFWQGNSGLAPGESRPLINLERDRAIAGNVDALLDRYNLLFLSGTMSAPLRALLREHLLAVNASTGSGWQTQRVQDALWLILNSPDYVVEK